MRTRLKVLKGERRGGQSNKPGAGREILHFSGKIRCRLAAILERAIIT